MLCDYLLYYIHMYSSFSIRIKVKKIELIEIEIECNEHLTNVQGASTDMQTIFPASFAQLLMLPGLKDMQTSGPEGEQDGARDRRRTIEPCRIVSAGRRSSAGHVSGTQ